MSRVQQSAWATSTGRFVGFVVADRAGGATRARAIGRMRVCAACRRNRPACRSEARSEVFFCGDCRERAEPWRPGDPYDELGGGD
jgi:hypothetical protein